MQLFESGKRIVHLNGVFKFVLILSGLLVFLSNENFAQTNSEDSLTISRPDSIDEATWERLRTDFEKEKQGFVEVLRLLDANRIDYTRDSMNEVIEKQTALRRPLGEFQSRIIREMAQVDLMLNYVFMRNETSPRLTGDIIDVGPEEKIKTLSQALAQVKSGDCIRLGNGEFAFGDSGLFPRQAEVPSDIAIVGSGRGETEMKFGRSSQIESAVRWRISNVSINCGDNEVAYLRSGGSIEFRNCLIFNYNSGAGGSNAIGGSNVAIVVENSEMEGDTGRSSGRGGGDAFDLRGPNLLYARKVHFVENDEIIRASFPSVFDRCISKTTGRNQNRLSLYSNGTLLRDNQLVPHGSSGSEFQHDVDDLPFVNLVLGNREKLDARSEQIVETLQLKRHPAYWIGLLRHSNSEIRELAANHVEEILPVTVKRSEPKTDLPVEEVDLAIEQLDDANFGVRQKAMDRLEQMGNQAQAAIGEVAKSGSMEQRMRAKQLLKKLSIDSNLANDIECGRLLNWYVENRDKLIWNESAAKYQIDE